MRWLAGGLSIVLLLAGCAQTVEGAARAATTATKLLPSEDEITSAAQSPLSTFGFQPFSGGVEILPDGYRTDADASPISCAAVTDTAPRIVYEPLPVLEAARQSYFNWDEGVDTSGADVAVVRLATSEAAIATFDTFAAQWQQCSGTTVVKHVGESVIDADLSDVAIRDSVVSATVRTTQRPNAPASRYERALGVRGDALVEVSLAITSTGEGQADPQAAAVRIVESILAKTGGSA
ncbi:sensor domain-containing protein [Mycobacterium antarcticum]|uniref:sensor domain-containing protein n=1 Tax=unclassified Mycolicibacterium TaxID=2636767 RepID=UPI0023A1C660|nr:MULTISPECIES: sensor domain-containing protein [unclassified Mycolicibacterium]BDX31391.1 sensor domain-containing protein [Mycolicibacterium sp. TUM20985]GLP80538.1 sensor domain-containing protein [Mycolicibacterium sp. TUM20984]